MNSVRKSVYYLSNNQFPKKISEFLKCAPVQGSQSIPEPKKSHQSKLMENDEDNFKLKAKNGTTSDKKDITTIEDKLWLLKGDEKIKDLDAKWVSITNSSMSIFKSYEHL